MTKKVKSVSRRVAALLALVMVMAVMAVSAFASEPANPYDAVQTELSKQTTQLFSSAQTMVLATIGAGLVIFGIFLLFKLGKKAIAAATGSRG